METTFHPDAALFHQPLKVGSKGAPGRKLVGGPPAQGARDRLGAAQPDDSSVAKIGQRDQRSNGGMAAAQNRHPLARKTRAILPRDIGHAVADPRVPGLSRHGAPRSARVRLEPRPGGIDHRIRAMPFRAGRALGLDQDHFHRMGPQQLRDVAGLPQGQRAAPSSDPQRVHARGAPLAVSAASPAGRAAASGATTSGAPAPQPSTSRPPAAVASAPIALAATLTQA